MLSPARTGRHATPRAPLRVALLCSRRAPGLPELLHTPERGRVWQLVALVASDPESAAPRHLAGTGVAARIHDLGAFSRARGARQSDLALRPAYDRVTLDLLRPFQPDLLVLCGYLHIVTAVLLDAFPNRVINIHDADLSVTDPEGRPRYRGLHAARDAILAGVRETRSTVHLATAQVDVGPALVRSWAFPAHPLVDAARGWGATDILKAYAYAQREWMMRAAWGRLLARAIERFARDEVRFLDGRAFLAGILGPEDLVAPAPTAAPEISEWSTSA